MKKITPAKKRLLVYSLIVGGLAVAGLVFFGASQYQKAKYQSSSVILTGAESQLKLLSKQEKTELNKDKILWYTDIRDTFAEINEKNSNLYKATAIPAYTFTTLALVAFGLCLKYEDKAKEKEEEEGEKN